MAIHNFNGRRTSRKYNSAYTEISKVNQFLLQVEEGAEIDWRSVAGFLGDWGIGNAMEKNNAVKSARERLAELEALKYEKLAEQSED